jgi:NTE family protein
MPDSLHITASTIADAKRGKSKARFPLGRPPFERIALLLQGGGALSSYQAGVYEALAEADLHPDWVAGISIGAINAAIIAGNPEVERVAKLRAFWEGITANPLLDWAIAPWPRYLALR